MDHSLGTAGFLDSETATAQDAFDEFVAWCAAGPECVLRGRDVPGVVGGAARAGRARDACGTRTTRRTA